MRKQPENGQKTAFLRIPAVRSYKAGNTGSVAKSQPLKRQKARKHGLFKMSCSELLAGLITKIAGQWNTEGIAINSILAVREGFEPSVRD